MREGGKLTTLLRINTISFKLQQGPVTGEAIGRAGVRQNRFLCIIDLGSALLSVGELTLGHRPVATECCHGDLLVATTEERR